MRSVPSSDSLQPSINWNIDPHELEFAKMATGPLAGDRTSLRFLSSDDNGDHPKAYVDTASAPDFNLEAPAAPDPREFVATMAAPTAGADRFQIEEADGCDEDPSPHFSQGGTFLAHDTQNGRANALITAGVEDLDPCSIGKK